jgi:hypothetical protein
VELRSSTRILKRKAIFSLRVSVGAFNGLNDDARATAVLLHLAARIRDAAQGGAVSEALTTPTCRSVAASTVDSAVAERLLEALNPNEIALALAAADEVADRHQRVGRAAELAVDRARYEADRAERAFHAVEPENRLVARTLETRWETKLAALAEAEQALEAARHTLPPLPARSELEKLAADLSGLWRASTTSNAGQAAPSTRTVCRAGYVVTHGDRGLCGVTGLDRVDDLRMPFDIPLRDHSDTRHRSR